MTIGAIPTGERLPTIKYTIMKVYEVYGMTSNSSVFKKVEANRFAEAIDKFMEQEANCTVYKVIFLGIMHDGLLYSLYNNLK